MPRDGASQAISPIKSAGEYTAYGFFRPWLPDLGHGTKFDTQFDCIGSRGNGVLAVDCQCTVNHW